MSLTPNPQLFKGQQLRKQACLALHAIAFEGRSANDVLNSICFEQGSDNGLFRALVLGSCRYFIRLEAIANQLLQKPFKPKDSDLLCLIVLGLYQLEYSRVPDHAAISETVAVCQQLKKNWATNVVNGVLRNFIRQKADLLTKVDSNWDTKFALPDWLISILKPYYKGQMESLMSAINKQAPMTLRVNRQKIGRDRYLELLLEQGLAATTHPIAGNALVLEHPVSVEQLPHFADGFVSVQDAAAQLAAAILSPAQNSTVLDACAAPGGKTCHLLELYESIELTACDIDHERCQRISENLLRLQLRAKVDCQDLTDSNYSDEHFDAILLDAPCSATGVIRRHPDIKLLRKASDIDQLVELQQQILEHLWSKLKAGGRLLYATCSILPQENEQQIGQFLERHSNATLIPLAPEIQQLSHSKTGCQLIPGQLSMDGFYYALLEKATN
ncbi:16S rRNA (cytosine(967)-C(5))-methyltransferase RsmB [Kangiella profundi]|uniref:16S rRNA (cytosine(967)-C(5))-methyltransferase n=1 Tax=Kangiella profundi TaxID=1561924 RepID=A0A2K9AEY9_9GAMM|nr:16S rRNA (cytosine(967)-C(5))-methyltransferase RsmB [Kangiella profundi]AUD79987.1 16S rRNA (cytosine(967)-C(5))-methyltransferase RsmB [Kangiella profundi]GGE93563.1 ribosomal RNA small subunit methyltransferase B [Kangiella profundi]